MSNAAKGKGQRAASGLRMMAGVLIVTLAGALGSSAADLMGGWSAFAIAAFVLLAHESGSALAQRFAKVRDDVGEATTLIDRPAAVVATEPVIDQNADAIARIRAEIAVVEPYANNLCSQISGVKADVATGVTAAMEQISLIHRDSKAQHDAIGRSIANSTTLARAAARPEALIADLRAEMARRDKQIAIDAERSRCLSQDLLGLSPIVDTIASIAHRTQILSFNAAIEAGIAGQHGRAFAVVAEEVRNLARSVDQAVVQASDLIERSTRSAKRDLPAATTSAAGNDLANLVAELETLQHELSTSSNDLLAVIETVEAGHDKIVRGLSNVLGNLQFDDVVRQRLDHVAEELLDLSRTLLGQTREPETGAVHHQHSLVALMARNKDRYVMESQVLTYQAAVAGGEAAFSGGGAIELF